MDKVNRGQQEAGPAHVKEAHFWRRSPCDCSSCKESRLAGPVSVELMGFEIAEIDRAMEYGVRQAGAKAKDSYRNTMQIIQAKMLAADDVSRVRLGMRPKHETEIHALEGTPVIDARTNQANDTAGQAIPGPYSDTGMPANVNATGDAKANEDSLADTITVTVTKRQVAELAMFGLLGPRGPVSGGLAFADLMGKFADALESGGAIKQDPNKRR